MRLRRITGDTWTAQRAFLMGLTYHVEQRYGKALPWFEQACTAPDVYPPAEHFRAWALYWLGRPDEAASAFQRHLQLTPEEGDSAFGLGLVAIEGAQWDAAEAHFNAAIALQEAAGDRADGVAKAKARLAEVIEQRDGNLERAESLLGESLQLDPTLHEAASRRARLLRRLGDNEAADHWSEHARVMREAAAE